MLILKSKDKEVIQEFGGESFGNFTANKNKENIMYLANEQSQKKKLLE